MTSQEKRLGTALTAFGAIMLLIYPLAVVWPSGWAWHAGPPHGSQYFMTIVGVYATLGVFLIRAARDPRANLSLIWFTVWSSVVPALLLVAAVLGVLTRSLDARQSATT